MRPDAGTRSAAWRLWNIRYQVRIPEVLMFSQKYLNTVGYNISGDSRVDQAAATRIMVCNQTGAGLSILYSQGAPLDFLDKKKIPGLYNDIQEHLYDWERVAASGIRPGGAPPISDFRMLEAVAMELYPIAKKLAPEEPAPDMMRNRLLQMNRQRNPIFAKTQALKRHSDEQGNLKPYVSIVDRIEEYLAEE